MAITERITGEYEVGFLVDPEAHYVSLVDRGANQIPFKIVKIQKGEGDTMKKVLHKLIVPSGLSDDDVRKAFSDETAPLLKFQKVDTIGKFRLIEQVERDKFDSSTFELVNIGNGIKAVTGHLKEGAKQGIIAKIFRQPSQEVVAVAEAIAENDDDRREFVKGVISPAVDEQLFMAMSNVAGILAQEGWSEKDRRKTIAGILDTLREYLFGVLSISKSDALDVKLAKKDNENKAQADSETVISKKEQIVEEVISKDEQIAKEVISEDGQTAEAEADVRVATKEKSEDHSESEDHNKSEDRNKSNEPEELEKSDSEAENMSNEQSDKDAIEPILEIKQQLEFLKAEIDKLKDELQKSAPASRAVYRSEAQGSAKKTKQQTSVFKGILGL